MTSTVAVIPAFNEEKTIKKITKKTSHLVDSIIVVDDGSTYHTYEIGKTTSVKVVRHKINLGDGAALMEGINLAKQTGAKWIIAIDGDGEHYPSDMPLLLNKARSVNSDIVVGSRFLNSGYAYNMSTIRRISDRLSNLLLNLLYRIHVTDSQSDLRVYNRRVFNSKTSLEPNYSIVTDVIIKAAVKGFKIVEIPIKSVSKDQKFGHHNLKETFSFILILLKHCRGPFRSDRILSGD
jgi:glycosyltransferase involved in cell wall biosynthesis